jgi:argininosuccinate lyase
MSLAPEYVRLVLDEIFENARTRFLPALAAIDAAHLVMLVEQGIVSREDGRRLRDALAEVAAGGVGASAFDGSSEDLFFHRQRRLKDVCGAAVAGRLHTARSRNDIDMTMYRMTIRERLLDLVEASMALRSALVDQAARHTRTMFAVHTHTQPAQPTTVAHYFLGVLEQLDRDAVRLRAAFATVNRSPLGACAITGTGFPIDRARTSALLGFDGPTVNTYGSIATVDYLLEALAALTVSLVGVGRFLQDLLLWGMAELGYLRLADGFVQASSIMPQKRNPVALEHARAIASRAVGEAQAAVLAVHNTPFGDIVDTEDDLQPLVHGAFHDATRALRLLAVVIESAELDAERMRVRATAGWTTATELADTLTRDFGVAFDAAHRIAARLAAEVRDLELPLAAILARIVKEETGVTVRYEEPRLREILSAEHFVRIRQMPGGPAQEVVERALGCERERLEADRRWLADTRDALTRASERLREAVAAL